MRVMSYNILDGGVGRWENIARVLKGHRVDIVTLIEADDMEAAGSIARHLKLECLIHAGRKHSCAILSRFAIEESINHALLHPELTGNCSQFGLRTPGGELDVFAVHLHPRAALADEEIRCREVGALLEITRGLRESRRGHLLMGDFNANSPIQRIEREKCKPKTQREMEENGGFIPREAIGRLLAAGYVDTLYACNPEYAVTAGTFTTAHPGQRLDFIFAGNLEAGRLRDAWVVNSAEAVEASDHFPVGLELV